MNIGRNFLERMRIRELPGNVSWRNTHYESFASPLFIVRDAVLYTSAGILAINDVVIEETLAHTSPVGNRYHIEGRSIEIDDQVRRTLSGANASLLAGSCNNYFHSMIDSVARLAIIKDAGVSPFKSLLLPKDAPKARHMLELASSDWNNVVEMDVSDTIEVEHLILPWTVHGQSTYHPCIKDFFNQISNKIDPISMSTPKRIYISRTCSSNRRLSNEADVIDALARVGFAIVNLETLSLQMQIQLFRGVEFIVAPHGAGLTNMVFAGSKAIVLELLMDSYVNWCFRHLAAMLGLQYDCVIGRAQGTWSLLSPAIHGDEWIVSVPHVVAAVDKLSAA